MPSSPPKCAAGARATRAASSIDIDNRLTKLALTNSTPRSWSSKMFVQLLNRAGNDSLSENIEIFSQVEV